MKKEKNNASRTYSLQSGHAVGLNESACLACQMHSQKLLTGVAWQSTPLPS